MLSVFLSHPVLSCHPVQVFNITLVRRMRESGQRMNQEFLHVIPMAPILVINDKIKMPISYSFCVFKVPILYSMGEDL